MSTNKLFLLRTGLLDKLSSLNSLVLTLNNQFANPCTVGRDRTLLDQHYCELPCDASSAGVLESCAGVTNTHLDLSSSGITSILPGAFEGIDARVVSLYVAASVYVSVCPIHPHPSLTLYRAPQELG